MQVELQRFAEAFNSEDELRRHVATLLGKLGDNRNIEITHGAQEYGKDIIFYSRDAIGDWILNACVVKNAKIMGSADDKGARNVLIQVEQALDTPFLKSSGESESVSRVYVISPYDCSQSTMHSIQGKLRDRSGQVTFLCGSRLLEKFVQSWPEFLVFESTLLGAYVAALQKRLDQDDPIGFLMFSSRIHLSRQENFVKCLCAPRISQNTHYCYAACRRSSVCNFTSRPSGKSIKSDY